ncbi:hypothetical protein QBC33DRAFT_212342 [Phialemonium atrogriseum]|uniref:Uncharacterized protein n=1 Tax=Phialemonium atrogriseum TaxID=1093897 RepID=A0AAJ0FK88_9PEZI|nr:uncharacterized protein QBC33DRAFT_212342 [Phialemonium atrogriseum]KAK1763830.1 hypothetical protein QBC33DRAFT_212342 [Phialemonium atrogriseum]
MCQTFGIVRFYNSAKMLSSSPKILAWFLLALPAFAQDECTATGVDFTDGGTYSVDSSSTSKFTFATIFSGCDGTANPILHAPDGGDDYTCSSLDMSRDRTQQISTCDITFSEITSGNWSITMVNPTTNETLERIFYLVAAATERVTTTVTPTVIVGYTSTPLGSTIIETVDRTLTQLFPAATVTSTCTQRSQTVTSSLIQSTETFTTRVTRTATSGSTTLRSTVYGQEVTATCHYDDAAPTVQADHVLVPAVKHQGEKKRRHSRHIYDRAGRGIYRDQAEDEAPAKREVAATTVTIVETTFTYSSTFTTIAPTPMTTETTIDQTTISVTPSPSIVCGNPTVVTQTVTVTPPPASETGTIYLTTTDQLTLWIITTMDTTTISVPASATACWDDGGVYY